jgi:hypothetical protein
VSITDVTIANGLSKYGGGGGIRNKGSGLLVKSSLIMSNSAILGGGIDNSTDSSSVECSTTHILDSTISNNQATDGPGGGISSYSTPNCNNVLIIESSEVSENSAIPNNTGGQGGAIFTTGPTHISNSVIKENKANTGGGITAVGSVGSFQLTIISSQVADNQAGFGGGIFTDGNATTIFSDTVFARNEAFASGGGILNGGEMKVVNSRLIENSADFNQGSFCGGAILNSSDLWIESTEIRDNSAGSHGGGGICNGYNAIIVIVDSLLAGNSATGMEYFEDGGGAINNNGHVTITNSTLGENKAAGRGGGIYNVGEVSLLNVTLNRNSAEVEGGGIFNLKPYQADNVYLVNSIVANNGIGGDCVGQVSSEGHNVDSDGSCELNAPGDQTNTDPRLGPLQDNGGQTDTYALLILSPAIDTGDDSVCPATDQRGVLRPIDGDGNGSAICDIGAYESETYYLTDFVYIPIIKSDLQ